MNRIRLYGLSSENPLYVFMLGQSLYQVIKPFTHSKGAAAEEREGLLCVSESITITVCGKHVSKCVLSLLFTSPSG